MKFIILILTAFCVSSGFTQTQNSNTDYTRWGLPEGAIARLGKGSVTGKIEFSPDSKMIAIPTSIGIWLYDADTYKELALLPRDSAYNKRLAFSPNSTILASVENSHENIIHLWDMSARTSLGKHILSLKDHKTDITSITFSSDGKTLASISKDRTTILWNTSTYEVKFALKGQTKGTSSLTFAPDNNLLANWSIDGTIELWNAKTGNLKHILNGQPKTSDNKDELISVAFSPDSRMLVSLTNDGTTQTWDTKTGKHIRTIKGILKRWQPIDNSVSLDMQSIVIIGESHTTSWSVKTGRLQWMIKERIHISPDWSLYATTTQDKIILWDMKTRKQVKTIIYYKSRYQPLVFSPDSKKLANDMGIWNINTGKHTPINEEHVSTGSSVKFLWRG